MLPDCQEVSEVIGAILVQNHASPEKPVEIGLPKNCWGLEDHRTFFDELFTKGGDVDEVKLTFAKTLASAERIKKDLAKFTIKELEKRVRPMHRLNKPQLVERAYSECVTSFAWLTTGDKEVLTLYGMEHGAFTPERRAVAALTQEGLDTYLRCRAERVQRLRERTQAQIQGLKDPQSLEDFKLFIRVRGQDKLTPEQLVRYDELVAVEVRGKRESANTKLAEQRVTPSLAAASDEAEPEPTDRSDSAGLQADQQATQQDTPQANEQTGQLVNLQESVHTRKKTKIFVVSMSLRVDRGLFDEFNARAKQLGGYYSSYARDGAIPGFTFSDSAQAQVLQAFIQGRLTAPARVADPSGDPGADHVGQGVDGTDVCATSTALAPVASATSHRHTPAQRLNHLAQRLEEDANGRLQQDRLVNTPRRAGMAERAEKQASRDLALATTMKNLAQAIADGCALHLGELRDKVQVELLEQLLARARRESHQDDLSAVADVEWPSLQLYPHQLHSVVIALGKVRGALRLAQSLKRLLAHGHPDDRAIVIDGALTQRLIEAFGDKAKAELPWFLINQYEALGRLERMGITCIEQLRAALREFVLYRKQADAIDPIKAAERAIIGSRVGLDFFPTPASLADRMCAMAGVRSDRKICEPQAGNGMIADAIRRAGGEPVVCEISHALAGILLAKGYEIVARDFLEYIPEEPFDCIIANPPFSDNLDIRHTRHAFSMLAQGGDLVTIVGAGAMQRSGAVETEFRQWLEELGAHVEKLPDGTFTDRSLLATTGAAAYLVHVQN